MEDSVFSKLQNSISLKGLYLLEIYIYNLKRYIYAHIYIYIYVYTYININIFNKNNS